MACVARMCLSIALCTVLSLLPVSSLDQGFCAPLSSDWKCKISHIWTKDLRGNPKPRVSPDRTGPDRTETGPGSGNSFKNIFGSGRVGEFYFGSVRVGEFYFELVRVGVFFTGYETFSPGISGINLPFIPKLWK